MLQKDVMPALLTHSEIEWLVGNKQVTNSYGRYMKFAIQKKLRVFMEIELPLLAKAGLINLNVSTNGYVGLDMAGVFGSNPTRPV
jgi:hypothetical protein